MTEIERLLAIEEIKRLKSKYFYYLDHKDWEGWRREVWAPDASLHVPESRDEPWVGIDTVIDLVSRRMTHQHSTHHGHMPDIEILTDSTARGIWAMEDILRVPPDKAELVGYTLLHGWGHYHETYVKLHQGWRIRSTSLTRLYVERS